MTVTATVPHDHHYILDNDHDCSSEFHNALAGMLDPVTQARIRDLPLALQGAACLELGAGDGSVALWLADRVGPTGRVVASDVKPMTDPGHPRLGVVAFDLASGEPLAEAFGTGYHLIHARLTLSHVPGREALLAELARLLTPGGWLLIEDWAPYRTDPVISAPDQAAAQLVNAYVRTVGRVFDTAGTDPVWGRRIHAAMLAAGLAGVNTQITGRYWRGGDPESRHTLAVMTQLRAELLAAGMTADQLERLSALLADPELVVHGHPLYSTAGQRPGSD